MTEPLFQRTAEGEVYYYQNDHLGTPQRMIESNGATVWEARYSAFGEAIIIQETVESNLRLPGQYFDSESGLHHNYFRDYESALGRYLQSDPIGMKGGLNFYAYVQGNPLYRFDPKGLRMHCTLNRISSTASIMSCYDSTAPDGDKVVNYEMYEPAESIDPKDPYGENGKLPPGCYELKARPEDGRFFAEGTPQVSDPDRPSGVLKSPNGTMRYGIAPHAGKNSKGCPLFPYGENSPSNDNWQDAKDTEQDFYGRFDDNENTGGTTLCIY